MFVKYYEIILFLNKSTKTCIVCYGIKNRLNHTLEAYSKANVKFDILRL